MSAPRIVIAAGGTAGHVVPAIAVADALRAEGAEVSFVGGQRAEAELVPAAGYPLDPIRVEGISRTNPLKAARAAGKAALALREARAILRRRRADAVLGGGGYVAGPVGLAAVLQRIPLVLTEADSHMGMSNRLLAGRARRVCLAFPLAGRDGPRYLVTGRPVPPRVADRDGARTALGIGPHERCLLVFGGSLGARSLNHAAVAAFADAPYRVLHVAGRRDFPDLTAPGPHYDLRDYLTPFGQALAAADLAVARAGGSIFELAQYGLPAVLVPYPHATADHQTANARWMVEGGAATVIADAALTPEGLRAAVDAILLDPARLREMAAASARLARPDAARDVAHAVLAAASGPSA
jgi:UDP-N-acetylglucosamine--N-acetylmuramyl-(pentapeptide) pyrophosphoryl-undecaprenol N-acetylglucosamine transferase